MEDTFSQVLTLTSFITRRFIHFIGEFYSVTSILINGVTCILHNFRQIASSSPLVKFRVWWFLFTYIIIAEDLFLRDLSRCLEDWGIISCGQNPASYSDHNSVSMSCLSSTHCNSSARFGIHKRRASNLDFLLVNSRLEIVHRRHNYGGVHFILKG